MDLPPFPGRFSTKDKIVGYFGAACAGFYFATRAIKDAKEKLEKHRAELKKIINFDCYVDLNDDAWQKLKGTREWDEMLAAHTLSSRSLFWLLKNEIGIYYFSSLTSAGALALASSNAAELFGKKDTAGPLVALGVTVSAWIAGVGIFGPLKRSFAKPPGLNYLSPLCVRARELAGAKEEALKNPSVMDEQWTAEIAPANLNPVPTPRAAPPADTNSIVPIGITAIILGALMARFCPSCGFAFGKTAVLPFGLGTGNYGPTDNGS